MTLEIQILLYMGLQGDIKYDFFWLIRKGFTSSVEKTPYFYLYFTFLSTKEHLNENPSFLGETLQKHEKGP